MQLTKKQAMALMSLSPTKQQLIDLGIDISLMPALSAWAGGEPVYIRETSTRWVRVDSTNDNCLPFGVGAREKRPETPEERAERLASSGAGNVERAIIRRLDGLEEAVQTLRKEDAVRNAVVNATVGLANMVTELEKRLTVAEKEPKAKPKARRKSK